MGGLQKDDEVDDPEGAKARLFGMFVNEVSLVDRAANKRTYLVTKRDQTMPNQKLAPAAKGAPAAVTKAPGPTEGEASSAAGAAGAPPGGTNTGAPAPAQSDGTSAGGEALAPMQPQVKDALVSALASIAEKAVDLGEQLKDAQTDEKAPASPPVPASIATALKALGDMVTSVLGQYAPAAGGETGKAGPMAGVSDNGDAFAQGAQKADDEEMEKAFSALLAKAGKKMAKERLARFGQALNMLAAIHRELKISKRAGGAPAATEPGMKGELAEIAKALESSVDSISALEKRVAEVSAENAKLRKAVGGPNSSAIDAPPAHRESPPVVWPLDMNKPRAAKSEATSFAAPRGR